MRDLRYIPESFVGPCPPGRIEEFTDRLCHWHERSYLLPQSYIEHQKNFHGGVPTLNCFKTSSGEDRFICRFLNFGRENDYPPPYMESWRYLGHWDVRYDYSVWNLVFGGLSSVFTQRLLPFAAIDTDGFNGREMREYDTLCFDFGEGEDYLPRIVALSIFDSAERKPVTEFVSPSFENLVNSLSICDKSPRLAHCEFF